MRLAGQGDNVFDSSAASKEVRGLHVRVRGRRRSLAGGAGNDTLIGSPEGESLLGQEGDDDIFRRVAATTASRAARARIASPAVPDTTASYAGAVTPTSHTIGDGPAGAAG